MGDGLSRKKFLDRALDPTISGNDILSKDIEEFKNNVYLYCEDNSIPRDHVSVKVSDGQVQLHVSPKVDKSHLKGLKEITFEFYEKVHQKVSDFSK